MKTLEYIAFVELNVAGAGPCMNEIATKVSLEMKDEDYDQLMQLVETYKGEKWKIAKAVEKELHHIHNKLMKGAMDDVRYLLTVNAVESGYSEFTERDLWEKATGLDEEEDYDDEDEENHERASEEDFELWQEEEHRKIEAMSREELTQYYTDNYEIELDFDENDFSYRFTEDGRKGVFTEWF